MDPFRTYKFESCMLILGHGGVKVREKDGALWEATGVNEETQVRLDDMDRLSEEELTDAMNAHSWHTDLNAFRAEHHPSRVGAFELKYGARFLPVASSLLVKKASALEAVEWVGGETSDLLVRTKHIDRELLLNLTCYTSIRLVLKRVPEFEAP